MQPTLLASACSWVCEERLGGDWARPGRTTTTPAATASAAAKSAVERGVNEHEIGRIVRFGLDHPAVKGINFQPAFHAGRHAKHDPMQRMTNPDIIKLIEEQTEGLFRQTACRRLEVAPYRLEEPQDRRLPAHPRRS